MITATRPSSRFGPLRPGSMRLGGRSAPTASAHQPRARSRSRSVNRHSASRSPNWRRLWPSAGATCSTRSTATPGRELGWRRGPRAALEGQRPAQISAGLTWLAGEGQPPPRLLGALCGGPSRGPDPSAGASRPPGARGASRPLTPVGGPRADGRPVGTGRQGEVAREAGGGGFADKVEWAPGAMCDGKVIPHPESGGRSRPPGAPSVKSCSGRVGRGVGGLKKRMPWGFRWGSGLSGLGDCALLGAQSPGIAKGGGHLAKGEAAG